MTYLSARERKNVVRVDTSLDGTRADTVVGSANAVGGLERTTVERKTHDDLACSSALRCVPLNSGIGGNTSPRATVEVSLIVGLNVLV